MKKSSIHLATRIFNTPLLIHPAKANVILRVLGPRLGIDAGLFNDDDEDPAPAQVPVGEVEAGDGICVISIQGTLVKRSTGMDAMSGLQSYADIQEQVEDAITDPACKGIVFDIDSPGGEVAGMFDLAEFLVSVRGRKPMYGAANDAAYSAAYALASCLDRLYVTSVGGVGSIGCYCLYTDQSEYDKKLGVKYNYIYAGDRKIDGNPNEPLSSEARATAQAEVDRIRDMFVTLVAKNRNVSADALLATEAGCYFGTQAVPLLADKLGTLADAVKDMRAALVAPTEARGAVLTEANIAELPAMTYQTSQVPAGRPAAEIAILFPMAFNDHAQGWADHANANRNIPALALRSGKNLRWAKTSYADRPDVLTEISCCVAPYNKLSCDLGGFKEIYEPNCFAESLASGDDARVLFNHNPDYVLGRRSAATAEFYESADGLCFNVQAPQTQWADDLLVSMRRGDITQGSAAFYILKYHWAYDGSQKIRVVEKAKLVEASVTSFAAYESTSATVVEQQAIAAQQGQHNGARLRLMEAVR